MDVRMREVPAQVVVTEQRMVDQQSLGRWLPEAMARVRKTAGSMAGGTAEQPYLLRGHVGDEPVFIVIYEGNPNEGETAVECCAPLHADGAAPDGAATRTIPAHREAYARVLKRTVQSGAVGDVYVAIGNWIEGRGLAIAAAPREAYWTDFYSAAADDEVFDVAFPVRRTSCVGGPAAEMTIGEFSRRSQLSLKALRLYERLGLLRPVLELAGAAMRGAAVLAVDACMPGIAERMAACSAACWSVCAGVHVTNM